MLKRDFGFTLVELMVAIVIIGVLTALAISLYNSAVKRAKLSEAKIVLKRLWECNEGYYAENGEYYCNAFNVGETGCDAIGFSPLSGTQNFSYAIICHSPPTYVAVPNGNDSSLEKYEIQRDCDGNLTVFEPGQDKNNGKEREGWGPGGNPDNPGHGDDNPGHGDDNPGEGHDNPGEGQGRGNS